MTIQHQAPRTPTGAFTHAPLAERFEACFSPEPTSGCWLWAGSMRENGYGSMPEIKPRDGGAS